LRPSFFQAKAQKMAQTKAQRGVCSITTTVVQFIGQQVATEEQAIAKDWKGQTEGLDSFGV